MGRRSQTERKKKPAHFGRDDRLAALAHRLALPGRVRDEAGFRLIGYVVMPEHVHLLIGEPREGTPSTVLHKLKPGVARNLRKRKRDCAGQLRLAFAASAEGGSTMNSPPCLFAFTFPLAVLTLHAAFSSLPRQFIFRHRTEATET